MNSHNNISCNECQYYSCFFKQYSSTINQRLIEAKKYQKVYSKGKFIIIEGNPIEGVYFVQHGKVKIFTSGQNESYQIVRLVNAGESLCFRGLGRKNYLTSSVAMEESRVCFFESNDLMELCSSSLLSAQLIKYLGDELETADTRLKYLMQMNVREKTAEALLFVKRTFGLNINNELDVYISRKDIAAIAGTSEELIIRQLSDFEKEKMIHRSNHGSVIQILNEEKIQHVIEKYLVKAIN